jgi:TonB family protein
VKKDKHKYHSIRKPNFLGSKKAFAEFLALHLIYPSEALQNKIEGTAHVKCEIDDKGKVLKAASLTKLGYGLDEEAERLCLLMKFENTTERGMRIKHTRRIRIPFVLPKPTTLQINYQSTPAKKEEKKTSYTYTIKF